MRTCADPRAANSNRTSSRALAAGSRSKHASRGAAVARRPGGSARSGSAAAGLAVAGSPPSSRLCRPRPASDESTKQQHPRLPSSQTISRCRTPSQNRKARELARTACLIWNAAHRMTTGPAALLLLALLALAAAVPAARLNRDSTDRPEVRNRPRPAPAACAPLPRPYTEMRVGRIVCRGMLLRGARPGS